MEHSDILYDKLDYLILANLVNSDESEQDIVLMVERFINCRYAYYYFNNIQNPPSETKKIKE